MSATYTLKQRCLDTLILLSFGAALALPSAGAMTPELVMSQCCMRAHKGMNTARGIFSEIKTKLEGRTEGLQIVSVQKAATAVEQALDSCVKAAGDPELYSVKRAFAYSKANVWKSAFARFSLGLVHEGVYEAVSSLVKDYQKAIDDVLNSLKES